MLSNLFRYKTLIKLTTLLAIGASVEQAKAGKSKRNSSGIYFERSPFPGGGTNAYKPRRRGQPSEMRAKGKWGRKGCMWVKDTTAGKRFALFCPSGN